MENLSSEQLFMIVPYLLKGAGMTIVLTVIILAVASPIAFFIAVMRQIAPSANIVFGIIGWIMRGVPPLIVLLVAFFVPSSLGYHISPLLSAIIALSAYQTFAFVEAFRAGLQSVPAGQFSGAEALGLHPWRIYTRIILPQALPSSWPPYISHAAGLLKGTSLASTVSVAELTKASTEMFAVTYSLQVLLIAGVIYACLCWILFGIEEYFEQRRSHRWAR